MSLLKRKRARSALLALASISMLTVAMPSELSAAPNPPRVITRYADGPITLSPSPTAVVSVEMPGRNWFVTAKLYVHNYSTGRRVVDCGLGSNVFSDYARVTLQADGRNDRATLTLTQTLHFNSASGGVGGVSCQTVDGGSVDVRFGKVTAIELGRLRETVEGQTASYGSGAPRLLSASRFTPRPLQRNLATELKLEVGRGRWLVFAKGVLKNQASNGTDGARCDLVSPGTSDAGRLVRLQAGAEAPLTHLLTTRLANAGKIKLKCLETSTGSDIVLGQVRISALKIGKIVEFRGNQRQAFGSGAPRVDTKVTRTPRELSPTGGFQRVQVLPLGAGLHTIYARVFVAQGSGDSVDDVFCRLHAGNDFDVSSTNRGYMMLNVSHGSQSPQDARLVCSTQGDDVQIMKIRTVAIRAGSLVNQPTI